MLDLKTMKSALEQLEQERKIPREKIIDAIEQALAAAYKKDYGKKGQIIRNKIDIETGVMEFYQVKIVVDDSLVRMTKEDEDEEEIAEDDNRVRFNEEHHILLEDAKKIKNGVKLEEEIIFPLENKNDYGRIAAQTAKQVIIQKIREAERSAIVDEYGSKEGEIVNGIVQKIERGIVYIDFNRATGIILPEEQIPGEFYRHGDRIKAYLYSVEETPRGVNLKLSRTHPQLIEGLFAMEAPEIASGVVEIKSIAREAGARSKIAVYSNDEHVDPVGSCVGQKGVRVSTVMNELNGEKIDIIPWSGDPATYIASAISPANVLDIQVFEQEHKASIEVAVDQLSLAIGKGGQNVRLAAKLTGWRIDIKGMEASAITNGENADDDVLDDGIVDDGTN
ncbi:MAG: transcription termination factor NusA [Candidatus Woesearchaeota archaeon]|jgi:N utilization substance protein A